MDCGKSANPYLAELIGTFALTFIGAGSIASGQNNLVGIALAHGIAIMTMIYAMGHISGDRKSTRLNSSHGMSSRMPSSA